MEPEDHREIASVASPQLNGFKTSPLDFPFLYSLLPGYMVTLHMFENIDCFQ